MAAQNNQVARQLKWLNVKEPDPFLLNVRELTGRNVNEELHTPSIRQPPQGPICVHGAVQNSKINGIFLPPPINQSTLASVSIILPQSSSDLDTDQGEIIDETIKEVVQSDNQMLLNLTSSDSSYDRTLQRQSVATLNSSDVHTQTKSSPTHTYRPDSPVNNITHPVTNFKQTKQIIIDIRYFITFAHTT